MPLGFVATEVDVVRHDGVLVTTLGAPSTEEDDFYLMVQHKDEFSEQDVKFGMRLRHTSSTAAKAGPGMVTFSLSRCAETASR
jgi:hypothetical protein